MSYALDTSKRKFHRILDSISNNSSTSLTTKRSQNGSSVTLFAEESAEQPVSKRPRYARPQSETTLSSKQSIANMAHPHDGTSNITNITRSGKLPAFMPWDRNQFLDRLKTFSGSVLNWAPKSDNMNEVEWAKRGWSCVAKETVGCSACAKRIVINLKSEDAPVTEEESTLSVIDQHVWQQNARKELATRYASMIVSGHYENCLWRTRGCDTSIQRLPIVHRATAIDALLSRYESLLRIHESLPSHAAFLEEVDLDTLLKRFLTISNSRGSRNISDIQATSSEEPPSDSSELNMIGYDSKCRAFGFALFGWNGRPDSDLGGNKLVDCAACFRRLGMWLWLPRPRPDGTTLQPCKGKMNVAEEHRHYCPWVNASTQNGGRVPDTEEKLLCGWETLVRAITNANEAIETLNIPQSQQELDVTQPQAATQQPSASGNDIDSETTSVLDEKQSLEVKDKDRWAKIKKLKRAFQIKKVKKQGGSRPTTAG